MDIFASDSSGKASSRKEAALVEIVVDGRRLYLSDPELVENVFCPTGPGGGRDPSCRPGGIKRTSFGPTGPGMAAPIRVDEFKWKEATEKELSDIYSLAARQTELKKKVSGATNEDDRLKFSDELAQTKHKLDGIREGIRERYAEKYGEKAEKELTMKKAVELTKQHREGKIDGPGKSSSKKTETKKSVKDYSDEQLQSRFDAKQIEYQKARDAKDYTKSTQIAQELEQLSTELVTRRTERRKAGVAKKKEEIRKSAKKKAAKKGLDELSDGYLKTKQRNKKKELEAALDKQDWTKANKIEKELNAIHDELFKRNTGRKFDRKGGESKTKQVEKGVSKRAQLREARAEYGYGGKPKSQAAKGMAMQDAVNEYGLTPGPGTGNGPKKLAKVRRTAHIKEHGMTTTTKMRKVKVEGVEIFYEDGLEYEASQLISAAGKMNPRLWRQNKKVIITNQNNKEDAHWATEFGTKGFVSAATGGDGNVVFYGGRFNRTTLTHESAHNLAYNLWGTTSPNKKPGNVGKHKSDFSDREEGRLKRGDRTRIENAVTGYGKNNSAEDFAEYVTAFEEIVVKGGHRYKEARIQDLRVRPRTFKTVARLLGHEDKIDELKPK